MKAFALLEFLVFMTVLSVILIGLLDNLKQQHDKTTRNPKDFSYEFVTLCNKVTPNCILDSNILTPTPFFDINATKTH